MTLASEWNAAMLGNYGTPRVELSHGKGAYVWDVDGNRYLDLIGGIAVSTLGHGDERLAKAISDQAATLLHTSNLYAHRPGLRLAHKLLAIAQFDGRVLFTQDGATANEAALKLVRRWGQAQSPQRTRIIAMNAGFHGRTMGALAVTGNPAKREPFAPFGIDVQFVDYGDIDALKAALDSSVTAVIVEPIQGEGGVNVPPSGYLVDVAQATRANGSLLIVDEIQSGIGRSGDWFMSQAQGVKPDLMTLAKGLAGGLPLGAVLVSAQLSDVLKPGDHGTTFGGNPVSCAAALAVIDAIEADHLLEHVRQLGTWLHQAIRQLEIPQVKEVRGRGLWIAIAFDAPIASAVELAALKSGFLVNAVKPDAIRLAPPLVVSQDELRSFVEELRGLVKAATQ